MKIQAQPFEVADRDVAARLERQPELDLAPACRLVRRPVNEGCRTQKLHKEMVQGVVRSEQKASKRLPRTAQRVARTFWTPEPTK